MEKSNTLTLKIINDQTVLDSFPKGKDLTEYQKELLICFMHGTAAGAIGKECFNRTAALA